ncbi:hypothetical protein [Enhygromyxa salina]|uniref:hypothetical protein n=1 Tax=Enhygromyxa salina TaxID=215803 RepID=UPI0011BACFC7|nr:hypothetical protein [Enhygromyxa salina]
MPSEFIPGASEILWEIESTHLDEAQFAFEMWEDALDSPDFTLGDLAAGPEQRLLAHVDALAIGGPAVAQQLLVPATRDPNGSTERVAVAVLSCQDLAPTLEALGIAEAQDQVLGLVRGLELRDNDDLDAALVRVLRSDPGRARAGLLKLLARRRVAVQPWGELGNLGNSEDEQTALAVARLARFSPDPRALSIIGALAQHEDASVRDAALQTALLRGVTGAWESSVYWAFTDHESAARRQALVRVACLGDDAARARVVALVEDPTHRADALWAAGFTGSLAAVHQCMPLLEDDEWGPLAAEVVCAIAGLPTDDEQFWRDPAPTDDPEIGLPPLQAENLDMDLTLSPEALLPVPDPQAIADWWRGRETQFDPSLRYLGGRVLDAAVLEQALHHAPLRRRHALAFELEARSNSTLHVATRALACVQHQQLARLAQHPDFAGLDFQRGRPAR